MPRNTVQPAERDRDRVVQGPQFGRFVGVLRKKLSDAQQHTRPIPDFHPGPWPFIEGPPRRRNSPPKGRHEILFYINDLLGCEGAQPSISAGPLPSGGTRSQANARDGFKGCLRPGQAIRQVCSEWPV
jgi:hypothetical protein